MTTKEELRRAVLGSGATRDPAVGDLIDLIRDRAPARVAVFSPMGNEPPTDVLDSMLRSSGFDVCYPRLHVDLLHMALSRPDALVRGKHGFNEATGPAVDPLTLSVVVVPGLAFGRDGSRLGRGKGHYDRYLTLVGSRCMLVGWTNECRLFETVPTEPHDVRMHCIVTEGGLHVVKQGG